MLIQTESTGGIRRMRRVLGIMAVVTLLSFALAAGAVERLSLATGGTAGTYYPIGSGIASIISKHAEGIEITAESTGASVANLKMLREYKIDMMMGASNTSWGGYNGHAPFDDKPVENIRGIACLYPEVFQFITLKDSGIKTIYDLKGKKVALGAAGSGTERTAKMVFEAHGMSYDDFDEQYLNFGEAVTALKDRIIDCAVVGAGAPTSAVVDATATLDITFVELDRGAMDPFCAERPYLAMMVLPGGTYKGQDKDVPVVASPAILSANDRMSEDLVYRITKALWENIDELAAVHAQGKNVKLETALSAMSVPLHPGAEKYYKEVGLLK